MKILGVDTSFFPVCQRRTKHIRAHVDGMVASICTNCAGEQPESATAKKERDPKSTVSPKR